MLRKLEPVTITPTIVSADVAGDSFEAAIAGKGDSVIGAKFSLKKRGVNQLRNWLQSHGVEAVHLWIEATGHYSTDLAEMAHDRGWKVTIVNPRCIKHFGIAHLEMNKTDKIDARIILRFAEAAKPRRFRDWTPKTNAQKQLRDTQIEILGLKRAVTCERNRLRSGITSELVRASMKATISVLTGQIKALRKESMRLIRSDAELNRTYTLLRQVKGFGDTTIAFLLARVDFNAFSKGRQLVKFAGLNPVKCESGKTLRKRTRIGRTGHTDLRAALYWPAIAAMRHDPKTAQFAQSIIERNKSKMVAICAVMARLLRVAFAIVRDSKPTKHEAA